MFPTTIRGAERRTRKQTISAAHELETMKLHLGCGRRTREGWVNVDTSPGRDIDVVTDLREIAPGGLPFEDDSFDEIFARELIERVSDARAFMSELYRIARPGCQLVLQGPHGASDNAWGHPGILRPFFPESFTAFGQPFYWRGDEGYASDWQVGFVILTLDRERYLGVAHSERLRDIREKRNVVNQMTVVMTAIKPSRPRDRNLLTTPRTELLLVEG